MKHCVTCTRWRKREEYNRSRRNRDGYDNTCKPCIARRRARQAPTGHGINRRHRLRTRYGIEPEVYDQMFEKQNGCCAICGGAPDRSFANRDPVFAIDHNHLTGAMRELLCFACNTKLSAIEDEQFMLRAKAYLEKHGTEFIR